MQKKAKQRNSSTQQIRQPDRKSRETTVLSTVGPKSKVPPNIRIKKLVKLTSHKYLLTFETVWQILIIKLIPGNGNRCKLAEISLEKLVKSHQRNLFCGGSSWTFFIGAPAQLRDRYSTAAHCKLTQVYSHTCTAVAVNVRFSQYRSRSAECAVALPPVDLTENISEFSYILLLWFQNLIIRRRKQQNQCRPLQIGSIFLSRRSLFLKKKTFFGWCNVKSDLSVTIINQKGKLIWAERGIKKNKIITNLCFMRWMSNKARNNLLILLSSQKTDFDCSNLSIIHTIRKFWKLLRSIS